MSSSFRSEVDVTDASKPNRQGFFRALRSSDVPEHIQLQIEFPRQEMSSVVVVHVDDFFSLFRSVMPDLNIEASGVANPALLLAALSAQQTEPPEIYSEDQPES